MSQLMSALIDEILAELPRVLAVAVAGAVGIIVIGAWIM